jgi:hypothetical protein
MRCVRGITRGSEILEIGCGPGYRTSEFLETLERTHGLDPDPAALSYAVLSRALFAAALTYERVVNRYDVFALFWANILAVLEKPSNNEANTSKPQDRLYRAG